MNNSDLAGASERRNSSTCNAAKSGAIDEAIAHRRKLAAERRKRAHFDAVNVNLAPARNWARTLRLSRSLRLTLAELIRLCGSKSGSVVRWACEPRQASIAKRFGVAPKTISRQIAALEKASAIVVAQIEGRRRTRGKSRFRVYLAVDGLDAAMERVAADGLVPRRDIAQNVRCHIGQNVPCIGSSYGRESFNLPSARRIAVLPGVALSLLIGSAAASGVSAMEAA